MIITMTGEGLQRRPASLPKRTKLTHASPNLSHTVFSALDKTLTTLTVTVLVRDREY